MVVGDGSRCLGCCASPSACLASSAAARPPSCGLMPVSTGFKFSDLARQGYRHSRHNGGIARKVAGVNKDGAEARGTAHAPT